MLFYLGTHEPAWLDRTDVPLFISHRRLARRRSFPRALGTWALDSGGFSELSIYGHWVTSPEQYAEAVARYQSEIGGLEWCAPQDWMCEPGILKQTGLTIPWHQALTIDSFAELRLRGLPVIPILQGWTLNDYHRCVEMYSRAGFDLEREPIVGIGTVCRRQDTLEATRIIESLAPLPLHGFGLKFGGLLRCGWALSSGDSMAWSYNARRHAPLPGCTHASCANCMRWALAWRARLLAQLEAGYQQPPLFSA